GSAVGLGSGPARPSYYDDIEVGWTHPAGGYHRVSLWHDRGTGTAARLLPNLWCARYGCGRLEMIMLHTVLFLRRLEGEAAPTRALGQGLFDRFCRDMDASMREMGVGDLAVPRKMRRIGEAFYGRQAAYRAALDAPDNGPLAAALQRNVFADGSEPAPASRLAIYVREAARRLAAQD